MSKAKVGNSEALLQQMKLLKTKAKAARQAGGKGADFRAGARRVLRKIKAIRILQGQLAGKKAKQHKAPVVEAAAAEG